LLRENHRSNGPLSSIIGKLYRHRLQFGDAARSLNFVSHPPLTIAEGPQPSSRGTLLFTTAELREEDRKLIANHLRIEFSLDEDPNIDEVLMFHKACLDIAMHKRDTIGELTQYLHDRDPSRSCKPIPIYLAIASEISKRTGCEGIFLCADDLKKYKSISRADFEEMIVSCIQEDYRYDPIKVEQEIKQILQNERLVFSRYRQIIRELEKYLLERMGPLPTVQKCISEAKRFVSIVSTSHFELMPTLEQGMQYLRRSGVSSQFTDEYLMAVIAWEVFTDERELSSVNSESAR